MEPVRPWSFDKYFERLDSALQARHWDDVDRVCRAIKMRVLEMPGEAALVAARDGLMERFNRLRAAERLPTTQGPLRVALRLLFDADTAAIAAEIQAQRGHRRVREPSHAVSALTGFDPSREDCPRSMWEEEDALCGVKGYMCLIDFECEVGAAAGGNRVFPSIAELRRCHPCVDSCGIAEVRVVGVKIVQPSRYMDEISDSDGSGEAGETGTGSTEGDSAGPKDIAQGVQP